jgi:hypothetical protein
VPPPDKARLFVLTDIANEPDDQESLVRLLAYANEFDVEGLVATTSTFLRGAPREDLIRKGIEAYGQVQKNLSVHAPGYPTATSLAAVAASGQTVFGIAGTGPGKGSTGSNLLIAAADKPDPRPLWVTAWGGSNTLAQALVDVRATRTPEQVDAFVAKLRVYTISDQDDAGPWLRKEFPGLFYIVSPSNTDSSQFQRATWTGISGDRFYQNSVSHVIDMVLNPWLEKNIISKGPLGAFYPRLSFIMEGDTPSFLGLINNGLGWSESPAYGGWGGRYVLYKDLGEPRAIWTDNRQSRDTVTSTDNGRTETSNFATIWRWREHYQNDFAARMDWSVTDDFTKANHNPVAVVNGDNTKKILRLSGKVGEPLKLSAEGTRDPDAGQTLKYTWWVYTEASRGGGMLSNTDGPETEFTPAAGRGGRGGAGGGAGRAGAPAAAPAAGGAAPAVPAAVQASTGAQTAAAPATQPTAAAQAPSGTAAGAARGGRGGAASPSEVHVILQVEDNGTPHLVSYRRIIGQVTP